MDFEVQFIAAIVVGIIGLVFAGILASRILKEDEGDEQVKFIGKACLLYTSPSPRDRQKSRMPSSA